MIGGAPFFMEHLRKGLSSRGFIVFFVFSLRKSIRAVFDLSDCNFSFLLGALKIIHNHFTHWVSQHETSKANVYF